MATRRNRAVVSAHRQIHRGFFSFSLFNRRLPSKLPGCRPNRGVTKLKHNGYRMMVRRDGSRVRCFRSTAMTARTASWLLSKPLLASRQSFLIDGKVVIARDDGTPDFHPLRSQRRGAVRLRPD